MSINFDRRNFLKLSAGAGAGIGLSSFTGPGGNSVAALLAKPVPAYRSWQDLYRRQWTWDKVVRNTHMVNCWYQARCSMDVYVKDGLVLREEQSAQYERLNAELPDFNPRGCQKGCAYSDRMYDPTRVIHPLRRAGARGSGKWERVSWDDALTDIADTWLDVATEEGTDRVIWELGPGIDTSRNTAAVFRLSGLTQSTMLDMNSEIGDQRRGTFETFGTAYFEHSADDYFYSDLILIWAGNPIYTQIPNAHFLTEARYRGAKIITIAPNYSPSATKADLWIPVKIGTDAALALGVARLLIEDGAVNREFVREQSDLPQLVRADNGRLLSEADLKTGGSSERFYVLDEITQEIAQLPWKTLALGKLRPALEADFDLRLHDGSSVRVQSVYTLLQKRLIDYTPDKVGEICGIAPEMVLRLAGEIKAARRMRNITQSTLGKLYHGNLAERAMILLFVLTGNIGRHGAGFAGFPLLCFEGPDVFGTARTMDDMRDDAPGKMQMINARLQAGETMEQVIHYFASIPFTPGALPMLMPILSCGTLFWQIHAGINELSDDAPDWGRKLKRPVKNHISEALGKGWQHVYPKPGNDPRIMFSCCSNPFRRIRGSQKLTENFLPKLKKYVVLDWHMSTSAQTADYILPVAAWYEQSNLMWATPISPYTLRSEAATAPRGSAKTDWEIVALLAKKIQERARLRKIDKIKTEYGLEAPFGDVYDQFTLGGNYTEHDGDKMLKFIFESGKVFGDVTWEQAQQKSQLRFAHLPEQAFSYGSATEIPKDDSIVALTHHTDKKIPYPTPSGRIRFYIDHPLYHEYDEHLPRHKDPPTMGGAYPLMLNGGKARWSIHASWRDNPLMLNLHRAEPHVFISVEDAQLRGIVSDDLVRVHNDIGGFTARAAVTPTMMPGQLHMYHAWERHQFQGKGDINSVSPVPVNPVELAGGAGLSPFFGMGQPSMYDRETRVEIERLVATS